MGVAKMLLITVMRKRQKQDREGCEPRGHLFMRPPNVQNNSIAWQRVSTRSCSKVMWQLCKGNPLETETRPDRDGMSSKISPVFVLFCLPLQISRD